MDTQIRLSSKPVLRAAFIIVGGLLTLDTLLVYTRSSLTFGLVMPAIIGFPLLVIGLFMPLFLKLCRSSRGFRIIAFMASLTYALFGVLFAVTTALILAHSTLPAGGADAVIVLGGGIRGSTPTLTLKYRLDAAVDYIEGDPGALVIVSGGMGADERFTEAYVMKNYLIAAGVDPERIIEEDRSLSTAENFEFSRGIISERLGENAKVVFVTTRFHVFRSELTAKKLGLEAEGVPARGVWYLTLNDYLRECAALTLYFLRGDI